MRIIFTFLLALSITIGQAQITITSNDMPSSGDTLRYSVAQIDSLIDSVYLNSGANVVWDFSNFVPVTQGLNEYKAALSTPYAFFFFGFNKFGLEVAESIGFGQFTITDIYDFYENTSTKFVAEGRGLSFSGLPVPSFYTDKDEIYKFPLDYGDNDTTTFDFSTQLALIGSYRSTGTRINTVDAWGQVTTPYGTFSCIRVVTDVIATDSIITGFLSFGFPNVTREYKWLANGVELPIVQVNGQFDFNGNFVAEEVRYRDNWNITALNSPFAPNANFFATNTTPDALSDTVTLFTLNLPQPSNVFDWTISPNTFDYVNSTDSTASNPEVVFNAIGTYDVGLTISNDLGVEDTTKLGYIVVSAISTTPLLESNHLKLFPNPSAGQVNLSYEMNERNNVRVDLFDIQGRLMKNLLNEQQQKGSYQQDFSLDELPMGHYVVKIQIGNKTQSYKLMLH